VLNFSTNHAITEQLSVESSLRSCLSQHDSLSIPYDKDKFRDNAYAVPINNLFWNPTLVLKVDMLFILLVIKMSCSYYLL
jgi:hypothetical protein